MKRTTIHISAAIALLLGLAACTQDEAGFLPEGAEGTPIVFTATGLNPAATATAGTRAPADGNWTGVQSVAVLMDGTVKTMGVPSAPSGRKPASSCVQAASERASAASAKNLILIISVILLLWFFPLRA